MARKSGGQWRWRDRLVILAWYGVLVAACFFAFDVRHTRDLAFAALGRVAPGAVVQPDCNNHGTVSYRYVLDGQAYEGKGLWRGGGDCDAVTAGQPVQVWYRPEAPSESQLEAPAESLDSHRETALVGALLLPAVLLGAFFSQYRKRRAG